MPAGELRDFSAGVLQPGESRKLRFVLGERAFCECDSLQHRWARIPASLTIALGSSSRNLRLNAPVPDGVLRGSSNRSGNR